MTRLYPTFLLGLALALPGALAAESAGPTGEMMGNTCAACHGTHGRLSGSAFVPLAGMDEDEFIRAMREFRDNTRPSTLMHSVAKGFSDEETRRMAEFFAAQTKEE
ncbi:cytochrome c subunit of flavocytochrome c sulfide dehydrogenase [Thioalkalivibrio nitratireducens DSM 14787]|uniref:Cytochrome c subunit of flavocytochrome c sulfide dehydrogenase n=1 Tax=Thioalkalivibrio nitratireducens (strain DSM 14787 / UNIQEM 213 / ALEN2) TaxID=1255043 RepID=L0E2J3_THIND|nr:c-type cytochrome [Thioalkalivibrio nitratireducens]AGA35415.1 cytochrome c subunit of flavocytochrome c sulfide dehydrogenase [Thioalkalivibrio nitratireducens DSM 14787]